jgi:hypothetical protein
MKGHPMITEDSVRTALYDVWGKQACYFPHQWPDAFKRLTGPSDAQRTSLKPRFEAAIISLVEAYRDKPPPEAAALALIHQAFAHLDATHRSDLHRRLTELAEAGPIAAETPTEAEKDAA